MKIIKYPDGSSYVQLQNEDLQKFNFKVNSYEDLWHLNQIIDAWNHKGIEPVVTIPNLIDAQADKRFNYNESTGLKLVCKFLNKMQAYFLIFHPHNAEVVEALIDKVKIIDNEVFIESCLHKIRKEFSIADGKSSYETLTLMSSDAGGFKPLMKLCDKINWQGETFSASKSRHWDPTSGSSLIQQVNKEDFEGKDILIIDDICVKGGTFKGLSKILKSKNCGKLYLAVSHMTLQDLGSDPITDYFDHIFTTNSKYDFYASLKDGNIGNQPENLTVVKLF